MTYHSLTATAVTLTLLCAASASAARSPNPTNGRDFSAVGASDDPVSLVSASFSEPDIVTRARRDVTTDRNSRAARGGSSTVEIEGKLFYNDLRTVGHFDWRRDMSGNPGVKTPASSSTNLTNYLGALDVVADFYEIDSVGRSILHLRCNSKKYLGSATVSSDGSYSFSYSGSDNCNADGDTTPDIAVSYRLRFCNDDRCYSVETDDRDLYRLWHPHASQSNPLDASPGHHTLNTAIYRVSYGDDYALAANVYAGLTEATRIWHREESVPFDPRGDGEVFARYPSSFKSVASAQNDHQLHFPEPNTWIKGTGVYHEYGHIIHMRAWNGTTGRCGTCPGGDYGRDGDSTWSATSREYPNSSFAEGWANYVRWITASWPEKSCESIDHNEDSAICNADSGQFPDASNDVTYPNDGKAYARNVTKLLCDWYDDGSHNDDDPNMAGTGDHFSASLFSVWYNLDETWDWAGGASGLQVCDYVDYYVNGRKGAATVGAATHSAYESSIADLSYNNGLKCGLPTPD